MGNVGVLRLCIIDQSFRRERSRERVERVYVYSVERECTIGKPTCPYHASVQGHAR